MSTFTSFYLFIFLDFINKAHLADPLFRSGQSLQLCTPVFEFIYISNLKNNSELLLKKATRFNRAETCVKPSHRN